MSGVRAASFAIEAGETVWTTILTPGVYLPALALKNEGDSGDVDENAESHNRCYV